MSQYYITAFKTGSYPPITVCTRSQFLIEVWTNSCSGEQQDVIYYWARPHPTFATAYADGLPPPSGFDWAEVGFLGMIPHSQSH
jgi:glucan endo-1,3-alpha-glucosidase